MKKGVRKCRAKCGENCGRVYGVNVEAVGKCVGVGEKRFGERCEELLGEVCWGAGGGEVDVGRGVGKCVGVWGDVREMCGGCGKM